MFGKILTIALLFAGISSSFFYFLSIKKEKLINPARLFLLISSLGVVLLSGYLLSNILSHNFQLTYVWEFSSRELPMHLLLSTFFAGQEGSFLLWALFTAIIGLFLAYYSRKGGYESYVMGVYNLFFVFLLLMLVIKSPFDYVWESFENIAPGYMPENGRGLNPILENIWMIIHPPILFVGYAAMTVPYVYAIAGLIKREYQEWINISLPWTLAATGFLGAGIALGGFWSYETLGWGGFWGWDPVENSSLMPWLIAVAFVHTLVVQRRTGGLVRTNLVLAVFGFVFVLLSTFLTRSGVLGDASVHSFVDPGKAAYAVLLGGLTGFLAFGVILLLIRHRDIQSGKLNFSLGSREFFLSIGSIIIILITILVFYGTMYPVHNEILGLQKKAIEISFYNKVTILPALLMLITNAVALYLNWKSTPIGQIVKRLVPAIIVSMAMGIILLFVGIRELMHLAMAVLSVFSLIVNLELLLKKIKKPAHFGGYFSHIGVSFLLLGVILSGPYSISENMALKEGDSQKAFGYEFTFTGSKEIEKNLKDRQKFEYQLLIRNGKDSSVVAPVFYWSDFNNRSQPFLEPGILSFFFRDVYVSPRNAEKTIDAPSILISKGQEQPLPGRDSSVSIELLKFDMSRIMQQDNSKSANLGAVISVRQGREKTTDTVFARIDMSSGETEPVWKKLPLTSMEIGFIRLIPNRESMAKSQAAFVFRKPGEAEPTPIDIFYFEVSLKPYMIFVWIGMILTVLGFFISIFKYLEKRKPA